MVVALGSQKEEHQQQQQQSVVAVWSPGLLFKMSVSAILLFHSFSDNLQFHYCFARIPIHAYFKSTEVKTSSENFSSDNIWWWVWFIYWFFCLCLPPYYCFVIFVLTCCYIIINILLQCVTQVYWIYTEVKPLSEHSNRDNIRR